MSSLNPLPCQHERCLYCSGKMVCCECETIDGCSEWTCVYHGTENRERVQRHRELT